MPATIAVQDLKIGMFIRLDLGWMSHPFPLSAFKIASAEQIATIQGLGLRHITWLPEKSDLPGEQVQAAPAAAAPAATGGAEEAGGVKKRGIVWNSPGTPAKASTETATQTAQGTAPGQQLAAAPAQSQGIALPINFEPGSSRLAAGATSYIEPIASLLRADPSLANSDPLGAGWFFKVKLSNAGEVAALLDETAYTTFAANA